MHDCRAAVFLFSRIETLDAQTADPEFVIPEFFISLAPSVVTVTQGEAAMLTVTVRCNISSFAAVRDCNARSKFDLSFSEFPDGTSAQIADGRVGDNTVSITASSETKTGSFPVQVTAAAGNTTQVQTFILNIRKAASAQSVATVDHEPVAVSAGHVLAWEHHVLVAKTPEDFNRMADDLGRGSWELVSVVTRQNARNTEWVGFFKRPRL